MGRKYLLLTALVLIIGVNKSIAADTDSTFVSGIIYTYTDTFDCYLKLQDSYSDKVFFKMSKESKIKKIKGYEITKLTIAQQTFVKVIYHDEDFLLEQLHTGRISLYSEFNPAMTVGSADINNSSVFIDGMDYYLKKGSKIRKFTATSTVDEIAPIFKDVPSVYDYVNTLNTSKLLPQLDSIVQLYNASKPVVQENVSGIDSTLEATFPEEDLGWGFEMPLLASYGYTYITPGIEEKYGKGYGTIGHNLGIGCFYAFRSDLKVELGAFNINKAYYISGDKKRNKLNYTGVYSYLDHKIAKYDIGLGVYYGFIKSVTVNEKIGTIKNMVDMALQIQRRIPVSKHVSINPVFSFTVPVNGTIETNDTYTDPTTFSETKEGLTMYQIQLGICFVYK